MSKTTIKVSHKNGHTVVSNDKVEWTFGNYKMLDETIIASLVFQTIFMKFKELTAYSDDFTIDFTMEKTGNDGECGLFCRINGATIKNLTVETAKSKQVKGGANTGILIGKMINGTIENCRK